MKNSDQLLVNNIRILGVDMVQNANSGHPGIVLGIAPAVYILFKNFLNINVNDPSWHNRDRFVLSAGHGSALLYSIMYFVGFQLSIDDIKRFRKYGSKTAGHPEYWDIPGIEATTGPLGQGIAMGIGMAISEKRLNYIDKNLYNHNTYILCSDGDIQEGVSYESMSLAGKLRLNKLIILYDSNNIQLDGDVKNAFNEDVRKRVESANFEYYKINNGNDLDEIYRVINDAKFSKVNKPKFIEIKTIIGYGAPNENSSSVHGAPLKPEYFERLKNFYNFEKPMFYVYEKQKNSFKQYVLERIKSNYKKSIDYYNKYNNLLHKSIINNNKKNILNFKKLLQSFSLNKDTISTREICGQMMNYVYSDLLFTMGGSADLRSSTKITGYKGIFSDKSASNGEIWFGVREFSMCSIINGITLHRGLIAYSATFFCFSDYAKAAIRLSALMRIPSIFIFSHDSIFLGEDGPTHQPIEHLSMLREIINTNVWRPSNKYEMAAAIKYSFESSKNPNIIVTSRQNFIQLNTNFQYYKIVSGAYIISKDKDVSDLIIMYSGSEIEIALKVKKMLNRKKYSVNIVSVPCLDLFRKKSNLYKKSILNLSREKIFVIEASKSSQWYEFVPIKNYFGISKYCKSGNFSEILSKFQLNPKKIFKLILKNMKEE